MVLKICLIISSTFLGEQFVHSCYEKRSSKYQVEQILIIRAARTQTINLKLKKKKLSTNTCIRCQFLENIVPINETS